MIKPMKKHMKKILLIFLISLPVAASAQIWYVGPKSGVTFSNYKSQTPWKEVTNVGFSAGLSAFKQVKNNIGIGLELQYIQKGYYHKICNTITDQLDANYLEIPVLVDYSFLAPGLKNFKIHANLGFYAAYWLSAKYRMEGYDADSEEFDFDKNKASRFDFGPLAGGRIEYILRNSAVSLDFRYELGVLDLQDTVNDNTSNTNRAFIVGLSYLKILNF
jgi:hypothetical protein